MGVGLDANVATLPRIEIDARFLRPKDLDVGRRLLEFDWIRGRARWSRPRRGARVGVRPSLDGSCHCGDLEALYPQELRHLLAHALGNLLVFVAMPRIAGLRIEATKLIVRAERGDQLLFQHLVDGPPSSALAV